MESQHEDNTLRNTEQDSEAEGLDALARGAEPYWMQDVRIAQRKIADAMTRIRAARANQLGGRPSNEG